jgi:hypothetical protein
MITRRLFGQVTRALAALGTLLVLVGGIPAALVATVGWPLPRSLPRFGDITSALGGQSIDDAFLVKALAVVCWLAWAQFVTCVAAELIGWRRGRAPQAVPFAGALQPLVAQLVVTAALLVQIAPRPSTPPTVLFSGTPIVQIHEPAPVAEVPAAAVTEPEQPGAPAATYVVKPRDDLWSLAETYLGDGRRWRELFDLNRDRAQARGGALRRPNLIRPGWILRFPPDAVALAEPVATPPADTDPQGSPEPNTSVDASGDAPVVAAGVLTEPSALPACPDPSPVTSGPAPAPPETPTPAPSGDPSPPTSRTAPVPPETPAAAPTSDPSPPTSTTATVPPETPAAAPSGDPSPVRPAPNRQAPTGGQSHAPEATDDPSGSRAPVGLLGAGLMAAGVVVTLDRLRRAQQRRRPRDRTVRMPTAAAIPTEVAVRRAAHTAPAGRLDMALRAFARRAAHRQAGDPPSVSAIQVGSDGIEILLSQAIDAEPAPFTVDAAGQVWTLPATVADADLADGTDDIGAPLPALVSIGKHGDSAVLIDLEATASTALIGDPEVGRAAFRAMALELATSLWADTLDVVLVAADAQVFQPLERIRVAATLAEILPDVEAAAGALSDALVRLSAPTTLAARLGATAAAR